MRIGITGASGMLGTALVNHLSKIHQIFGIEVNLFASPYNGHTLQETIFIERKERGDLQNFSGLE